MLVVIIKKIRSYYPIENKRQVKFFESFSLAVLDIEVSSAINLVKEIHGGSEM